MLLQDWLWEQGVVGSNPVAPTNILNRWFSRNYDLRANGFFVVYGSFFSYILLITTDYLCVFMHFCVALCGFFTDFSQKRAKNVVLLILNTIINAEKLSLAWLIN